MKKLLIFFVIAILIFLVQRSFSGVGAMRSIQIGHTSLTKIELADTPAKQEQGLSGRASLGEGEVMLFVFPTPGYYAFWMKDMNFPIDIIFLDENFKVVGLQSDATPASYPQTFSPTSPAKYVLEVRAGLAEKEGLNLGSTAIFNR